MSTYSYKLTYNDHGNRNDDCDAAGDRTTDCSQQKKNDLEQGESQAQVLTLIQLAEKRR